MEIAEVVIKLVGKIEPVEEVHIYDIRLDNLKNLTAVVDELLEKIYAVKRSEYPQHRAHASGFFKYLEQKYNHCL